MTPVISAWRILVSALTQRQDTSKKELKESALVSSQASHLVITQCRSIVQINTVILSLVPKSLDLFCTEVVSINTLSQKGDIERPAEMAPHGI